MIRSTVRTGKHELMSLYRTDAHFQPWGGAEKRRAYVVELLQGIPLSNAAQARLSCFCPWVSILQRRSSIINTRIAVRHSS